MDIKMANSFLSKTIKKKMTTIPN